MNLGVILPAAGLGRRFAAGAVSASSKIEFELDGKAVFLHAAERFLGRAEVVQVLLAVDPDKLEDFRFRWEDKLSFLGITLVPGGKQDRWETVKLALTHLSPDVTHIAVHDAARPLASSKMIDRVLAAVAQHCAVVPGLSMADTVKRAESAQPTATDPLDALLGHAGSAAHAAKILETVPREGLWRVQTPQVFERQLLELCYAKIDASSAQGITDDASVVERAGHPVYIVEGDPLNLKLTHPADAELLEAVLKLRNESSAKQAAERVLFGDDED
ncbi:MAG: 2-C-methyl-D-erythritol 4-phosphate cytidylyltransferase [Phycisphaerales bacterium JB063]